MGEGHINGIIGVGSTGTYGYRDGPTINIPANSNGGYTITYIFWLVYAGQRAYRCYVNGIEAYPDAGFINGSAVWILHEEPPSPFDTAYDCINGGCIPKTTYNTPGKFANFANCQAACAKDSSCTGECVSSEQIAALQQAASNVRSRLCK